MPYSPLPNPWTGIPLVGALIDAIQEALVSITKLETGQSHTVVDSNDNPIFRIDEDGSVHIPTGTTVQADL